MDELVKTACEQGALEEKAKQNTEEAKDQKALGNKAFAAKNY